MKPYIRGFKQLKECRLFIYPLSLLRNSVNSGDSGIIKQARGILPVRVGEEAEGRLDVLGVGGSAGVPLAQEVECPEHIEDEDGRPAGEEEEHDQDEHVDHLSGLLLPL